MSQQQREHFRIDYPANDRGTLQIRRNAYPIIDISQSGIKFSVEKIKDPEKWEMGKLFNGSVSLLIGRKLPIEGQVIRIGDTYVTLLLKEKIPLGVMNEEHRFIIKTFNRGD